MANVSGMANVGGRRAGQRVNPRLEAFRHETRLRGLG
jgi:hypothetical protein